MIKLILCSLLTSDALSRELDGLAHYVVLNILIKYALTCMPFDYSLLLETD